MSQASQQLLAEAQFQLEKNLEGEVRLDEASRRLYANDASIYEVEPLGVVIPRTQDDLIATMEMAHQFQIPVLPRGSGSSLAGQTVGAALVIDCTPHLNRLLEINPEARTALVEPGLVLDNFNRAAASHGLKFGPDPASSDRATFGGMLGNNSTGAHSIQFGMSSDNLLALDTVLADGSQARWTSATLSELERLSHGEELQSQLIAAALDIRQHSAQAIKANWPQSWRRASGYSLNYLLPWSPTAPPLWEDPRYPPQDDHHLNLAPLFVGSEGTLALTSQATVRLVPQAQRTVLGVLNFDSVAAACDATPELLKLQPSSVELIPQAMIRLARAVPAYSNLLGFVVGDPKAILLVEFSGADQNTLEQQLDRVPDLVGRALTADEQARIWKLRKVALGLLMARKGDAKPLPFIEDVAVPVESLGNFVRGLERIFAENGTSGEFYAHASAGCLHVRPVINLKSADGVAQMRAITEQVVALAIQHGGAMSGEHGDGLARSQWLEATFGSEISAAFAQLKQAADPQGILNPGKVVDPPAMTEDLRYGPDYHTDPWIPILDFSTQENLQGAIEMCNGAGICRKDHGVMCPSFQATRDEMHSTRGRANLLRSTIAGKTSTHELGWQATKEALDLCLECKACKAECPSAVDMAKLKYEFLHEHYRSHRHPLRDHFFVNIEGLAKFSAPIRPLVNALSSQAPTRELLESAIGISAQRKLPRFTRPNRSLQPNGEPDVLFLSDPYLRYTQPQLEADALRVLEAAGLRVGFLETLGAGRPLISKGFLRRAKSHAQKLLAELKALDPQGRIPILGLEPSEIYTLNDEFPDFFTHDPYVNSLATRAYMLEEFLLRDENALSRLASSAQAAPAAEVLLHGHCYQKAQPPAADLLPTGQEASAQLLRELGWQVEIVDSGCCGMAGSFGYEAEHYELSMQIGELALFPAIRDKADTQLLSAPGLSCRSQIADGLGEQALHPIRLIADRLLTSPPGC